MGLFGAPVAHEDHERRAVLAAIELRQRLQEAAACSAQPRDKRVRLRMGLHTGSLVVGPLPWGVVTFEKMTKPEAVGTLVLTNTPQ